MLEIKPVAVIHSEFPEKFGIPRQSGLVPELKAAIVFNPEFRIREAFRGLEQYSHIWLLWEFSAAERDNWSPTVRPPRLGGNTRMGVFATRSPFRPNPLGLSVVKLEKIDFEDKNAPVLHVSGADLMDGTPIFDIKPYLPYIDSIEGASNGFALAEHEGKLSVEIPENQAAKFPQERLSALKAVLSQDPRPQYISDPSRLFAMSFAGFEITFGVENSRLFVTEITPKPER